MRNKIATIHISYIIFKKERILHGFELYIGNEL